MDGKQLGKFNEKNRATYEKALLSRETKDENATMK